MRIAILVSELRVQGGGDRQAIYLARELQEMGHEVTIFTPAYDRERCYPEACSRLHIVVTGVHPLACLPIPSRRVKDYFNMLRLAKAIDGPFDVINPHHWPPHWAAVWAARGILPAPAVVWMCNDPTWPAAVPLPGIRRMLWPLRMLSRAGFRYADRTLVRRVNRVVVLSRYAKGFIDATYGIDCNVVRSGVDVDALEHVDAQQVAEVRRRYSAGDGTFLALSLGILMPHRRLEDAIRGVALATGAGHDVRYIIAGTPDQYPEYAASLRCLTHDLGLDKHVIFAGAVSEEDLKLHYHACDAFLFPNERQTWALAVAEAMACGKPVVVSKGAAISEVLTDRETALLVPPRNPEAIAEALTALIEDATLRTEVAERARRYAVETMSWKRYARAMLDIFRESAPAPQCERAVCVEAAAVRTTAASRR
jgi:glycosyltransferase involved in cell wall biosynthesis